MSTHVLDVSGQRALTLTVNDPARTAATCNAKAGDDVTMLLGNAREVRLALLPNARIERRQYVTRSLRRGKNNEFVKDENDEYVYDEKPYEQLILVLNGSVTMFGRASKIDPYQEVTENTPHTSIVAKKQGEELHFTESGTLLSEHSLDDLLTEQG